MPSTEGTLAVAPLYHSFRTMPLRSQSGNLPTHSPTPTTNVSHPPDQTRSTRPVRRPLPELAVPIRVWARGPNSKLSRPRHPTTPRRRIVAPHLPLASQPPPLRWEARGQAPEYTFRALLGHRPARATPSSTSAPALGGVSIEIVTRPSAGNVPNVPRSWPGPHQRDCGAQSRASLAVTTAPDEPQGPRAPTTRFARPFRQRPDKCARPGVQAPISTQRHLPLGHA